MPFWWGVRIGFNTWSLATVPYGTFIPGLAEIGYRAIAISVVPGYTIGGQYVPNACALDELDAHDRQRIRRAFQERDLAMPSVIGNQSLLHEDADANSAALARLRAAIDLCLELAPGERLPTMNTGTGGDSSALPSKGQILVDRLGELADYAGQRGVIVCIEPHVGGAIDSVERSEWLVNAVGSPSLRLDFDVSHFEVQGVPFSTTVPRLAPLTAAAEIKDQRVHAGSAPGRGDGWVDGNGWGETSGPDGQPLTFQFLLGGEGDFDLAGYLQMMQAQGFQEPISFEASVQCQARPGYDGMAAAARTYRWMLDGWRKADIGPS